MKIGLIKDIYSYKHPALMHEKLAEDLIYSFSNKNDLILDIFAGSSTTGKMAILLNRKYVGVEISKEYCDISVKRISNAESEINQYLFK